MFCDNDCDPKAPLSYYPYALFNILNYENTLNHCYCKLVHVRDPSVGVKVAEVN